MTMATAPTRPVLRYHGGKWKLAPWIISHFPSHRTYVEAFAGAASVLMRKPRSFGEVYNDMDGAVVNIFRVLRDPTTAAELERRVRLTPFARDEFRWSYEPGVDAIDDAHKMLVRSFMGFGTAAMTRTHLTGFRANASRSGTTPATDWSRWPSQIVAMTERLRAVVIENRPAIEVMRQHDGPLTLHYADPPYPHATRSSMLSGKSIGVKHAYRHEMTDDDHRVLATALRQLSGMVVISGYACALYDEHLYPEWAQYSRATHADGARPRIERVWLNAAASERLHATPLLLGEGAA